MSLGRGPDTWLEIAADKKAFSTVGDQWDEEDATKLCRAMKLLLPGLALAGLLPHVGGDWSLVAFIGTLVAAVGVSRLWEESLWFKLSALSVALQSLSLCYQLVAQTMVPELMAHPLYDVAGYVATVAGAVTFVLLTVALWLYHRKSAALMAGGAIAGVALAVLGLLAGGLVLTVARIALAVIGTAALAILFVQTRQTPEIPQ